MAPSRSPPGLAMVRLLTSLDAYSTAGSSCTCGAKTQHQWEGLPPHCHFLPKTTLDVLSDTRKRSHNRTKSYNQTSFSLRGSQGSLPPTELGGREMILSHVAVFLFFRVDQKWGIFIELSIVPEEVAWITALGTVQPLRGKRPTHTHTPPRYHYLCWLMRPSFALMWLMTTTEE